MSNTRNKCRLIGEWLEGNDWRQINLESRGVKSKVYIKWHALIEISYEKREVYVSMDVPSRDLTTPLNKVHFGTKKEDFCLCLDDLKLSASMDWQRKAAEADTVLKRGQFLHLLHEGTSGATKLEDDGWGECFEFNWTGYKMYVCDEYVTIPGFINYKSFFRTMTIDVPKKEVYTDKFYINFGTRTLLKFFKVKKVEECIFPASDEKEAVEMAKANDKKLNWTINVTQSWTAESCLK